MIKFKEYVGSINEGKLTSTEAGIELEKYGYTKDTKYNSNYNAFMKGPITVKVEKAKNNDNLKAMSGEWKGSSNTYIFDQKTDKTVTAFLEMLDKKDPNRKPKLK